MMLYNVEFSQDGKIFDDYIGDYVKAWNAEEAKDYALTWYTENGGKEEDIEDVQVSLHDIENETMDLICSYMDDKIRERIHIETWENNLDFLIAYCEEDDSLKDKASRVVEQNKDLKKENEALKKKMTTAILPDNSEKVEVVVKLNGRGHIETHAFGIPDDMFATTLRCNRITVNPALARTTEPTQADYAAFQAQVGSYGQRVRTRMQELHDQGLLVTVAAAGDVDYSGLANAGLGEQYVVRRTDALISRILNLPNPYAIYPLRYGVQDRELITNAFFGEFSQPYQEGEVFKGEFELKPEIGYVDDAMMKTIFKSMREAEPEGESFAGCMVIF